MCFSFRTFCSWSPAGSRCSSWRPPWGSTQTRGVLRVGRRFAHFFRVPICICVHSSSTFETFNEGRMKRNPCVFTHGSAHSIYAWNSYEVLFEICHVLFAGIGYASHVIIAFGATSYITIIAWAFFYLFSSFSVHLPWATCGNDWNTGGCPSREERGGKKYGVEINFL